MNSAWVNSSVVEMEGNATFHVELKNRKYAAGYCSSGRV